jgi:hypothetical protein
MLTPDGNVLAVFVTLRPSLAVMPRRADLRPHLNDKTLFWIVGSEIPRKPRPN